MKKQRVAIVYGWAEGRGHDRLLRRELRRQGFTITRKAAQADAIIAHSGGVFLIPRNTKANLIMLVGMPYWPGKHPRKSLAEKIKGELNTKTSRRYLVRKTALNIVHTITKPRHHYRIWKGWKLNGYPELRAASFLIVRNQNDPFLNQKRMADFAFKKEWNSMSLPGTHDDLWINPRHYVDILLSKIKGN